MGRKCLEGKSNSKGENELIFIWDKLHELIERGEINDIINGKDIITRSQHAVQQKKLDLSTIFWLVNLQNTMLYFQN